MRSPITLGSIFLFLGFATTSLADPKALSNAGAVAPVAAAAPQRPPTPVQADHKLKPRATYRMGRRVLPKPKPKREPAVEEFLCPHALTACPVAAAPGVAMSKLVTLTDWFVHGFECMDTMSACGGCPTLGKGQNCNTIPNMRGAACNSGKCTVTACKNGFAPDVTKGTCIPVVGIVGQAVAGVLSPAPKPEGRSRRRR